MLELVTELSLLPHLKEQLLILSLVKVEVEPISNLLDDIQNLTVNTVI